MAEQGQRVHRNWVKLFLNSFVYVVFFGDNNTAQDTEKAKLVIRIQVIVLI